MVAMTAEVTAVLIEALAAKALVAETPVATVPLVKTATVRGVTSVVKDHVPNIVNGPMSIHGSKVLSFPAPIARKSLLAVKSQQAKSDSPKNASMTSDRIALLKVAATAHHEIAMRRRRNGLWQDPMIGRILDLSGMGLQEEQIGPKVAATDHD